MSRDFSRKTKLDAISELNITPLIDLAFCLLIIFMITTPVIEQYNRIDLPDQPSDSAPPKQNNEDHFITIDGRGQFHWGHEIVSMQELASELDRISQIAGEKPVVHIRGDKSLRYEKIFEVVNMLKERNLKKMSLDAKVN